MARLSNCGKVLKLDNTVSYPKGYYTPQGNLVKDSYASSRSVIIGYGKNVSRLDHPQPSSNISVVLRTAANDECSSEAIW